MLIWQRPSALTLIIELTSVAEVAADTLVASKQIQNISNRKHLTRRKTDSPFIIGMYPIFYHI